MDDLIAGYKRFRAEMWPERRVLFEYLARRGQQPRTMVIACSDSRVDPTMIFGVGPGELFIVRNVANLVPPYQPDQAYHGTSAALEFAVRSLLVENLIVLGHAMCGGIAALLAEKPDSPGTNVDFVSAWMRIARPARERVLACEGVADLQEACEHEAIKVSLGNLMTFPWIAERVAAGNLTLYGAAFDIRTGILTRLGADGAFSPV